jgi:DNA replicative helicase MCM subunit Mcm2 (Cdc46/Mcm family)
MRSTGPIGEDSPLRGRTTRLTDRDGERGVLDQLTNTVRAGRSRVLVVRGEPGVGKSALLDYLAGHAPRCRVVRAAGVESEMELAFAGLHQLPVPVLDRVDRLPVPQREAPGTEHSSRAGPAGQARRGTRPAVPGGLHRAHHSRPGHRRHPEGFAPTATLIGFAVATDALAIVAGAILLQHTADAHDHDRRKSRHPISSDPRDEALLSRYWAPGAALFE